MNFEVSENSNVSILELGEKSKFRDLLEPLPPDREKALGDSIRKVGVNIPIVAWFDGAEWWLVDGHHRRKHWLLAYTENQSLTEPAVFELKCKTEEEVCDWIEATHLNRRNLTEKQQKYLIGKLYNESKKPHGGNRKNSEKQGEKSSGHDAHLKTDEAIAQEHGVDPKTVRRAGDFAKGVDELPDEEQAKVLSGESDLKDSEVEAIGRGEAAKPKPKPESNGKPSLADLCKPFTSLVRKQGEIVAEFERMADQPGGEFIDSIAIQEMKTKGRNVQEVIKARKPVPHKACEGKGCKACKNLGYVKG